MVKLTYLVAMKHVSLEDVPPSDAVETDIDRCGLSDPLGTTDIAINHYHLSFGDQMAGFHAHMDQEEVFVVIEGKATFEILNGEVTVSEEEAIRFPAGEFKGGKNESGGDLVLVALGAPRDTEDMRVPIGCPECHHADMRLVPSKEGVTFVCPDCRGERVPIACPECDSDALRITLDDRNQPVVVCLNYGTEFATPPTQAHW